MSDWGHFKDEEESETVQEIRSIAQCQFLSAADRIVELEDELLEYRKQYGELS